MRRSVAAAFAVVSVSVAAGCGESLPTPSFAGRDCGSEEGRELNPDARRCLLESFQTGTPAFFVSRLISVEGDPITRTYWVVGSAEVQIAHDARQDRYGSGRIELMRCQRLVPVADWNRVNQDTMPASEVFIEDGCESFDSR
jgi:hypothetical protein